MQKLSLKDWVILLTILPTTLIGLSLAGYFSYNRYQELNNYLIAQAKSIIEPTAIASTIPLKNRNREKLRQLIGYIHRSHSDIVQNIAIFTQDNQIMVTSAYQQDSNILRVTAGTMIPEYTSVTKYQDSLIIRTPIIDDSEDMSDASPSNYLNIVGYIAMKIDAKHINYVQQQEMLTAFVIIAIAAMISAIFSISLIRNVTRPIRSIVQAIDKIREGKLETRVTGHLFGELNLLKNGVNAMAQSLGDYRDEMQRSVEQATTDLRHSLEQFEMQNVELDMAKKKAQEANRVKSEFLANMSHELRTPLNGVIGFTRQTLKTPLNPTQRDYLHTIERSANNLLVIINDILDFSKLDAGKMVIENIPFSFTEAIDECVKLLAPNAFSKQLLFSLNIEPNVPDSLIGDAMRIKQILINLTSNAIKFTKKGSITIDISVFEQSDEDVTLKICVTDTGIGMNQEQQANIFDAFGQADKSITRLYGGTGLGLVISQRLAQEMNGDIGFSSQLQKGSSFWFTFKCEVNPLPLQTPVDTSHFKGKSVLLYEPHKHALQSTSQILTQWQMTVTAIRSLNELNQIIQQQQRYDFAVIGSDIGAHAIDDVKQVISLIKHQAVKIHVALNSTAPYLKESLIRFGVTSCITKPVTMITLAQALATEHAELPTLDQEQSKQQPKLAIKVLAVDDNEANLKLIRTLLLEHVEHVVTATNGEQAVQLAEREKFALIFLDIQMPVMDGITARAEIAKLPLNSDTPIIAVTAHALNSEREQLLSQGFTDYLTKPLDEAMLHHCLYEYCELSLLESSKQQEPKAEKVLEVATQPQYQGIFSWELAIKRAANNSELALEMFSGLIDSLPETQKKLQEAIDRQDTNSAKTLIHKLNGACCYTGVPNLEKIAKLLETQLKQNFSIEELAPEWLEFFEHIEQLIEQQQTLKQQLEQALSSPFCD